MKKQEVSKLSLAKMNRMKKSRILCTGGSGFIGTHFAHKFGNNDHHYLNIDINAPKIKAQAKDWVECDILDLEKLKKVFSKFKPDFVLHLAARANTEGKSLDDFKDNTLGTANVLEAIKSTPSISRVIITSSQHVRKPGSDFPKHDQDFNPHGLYGESKVITENFTRDANLDCTWTIIRPTTIWGPWHPFLADGLWRTMHKGLYIHPSNDHVIRSYGYVENVIWQIEKIMETAENLINGKVYYIGEIPMKQIDWVNAFSNAITGRSVRTVHRSIIYALALVGDYLNIFGIKFPMQSSRYFNLTTTNPVPIKPVIDLFGKPPISLEQGIKKTINWLKNKEYFSNID